MAGVIVEIDAVLTSQSLARLGADLEKATAQLGTGLSAGASAPAQAFAKTLVTTLQTRLKEESAVLSAQLSSGILSPHQYQVGAQRLGREIMADLNRGIKSGQKLELFPGSAGIALRNQLQGIAVAATQATPAAQKVAAAVTQVGLAGVAGSTGLNRVRNGLVQVALSATGSAGPLGRLASSLLLFGGGGGLVLGVAAGAAVIGTAWQFITAGARKAKEETEKWIEAAREANRVARPEFVQLSEEIARAAKELQGFQDRLARATAQRQLVVRKGGESGPMKELIDQIKVAEERLAGLERQMQKVGLSTTAFPGLRARHPGSTAPDFETADANRRIIERGEKDREDADRKALQRAKEIARLREEAEKRVIELQEKSRELAERAQGLLAENTVTVVDDLELALSDMEREVRDFFDTIPPEWEQAFTQARDRIANVKLLEPIDAELQRLTEQASRIGGSTTGQAALMPDLDEMLARLTGFRDMQAEGTQGWQEWEKRIQVVLGLQQQMLTNIGDASVGVSTLSNKWQLTGETIHGIAEGLIEVGFRLGGISAQTADVLSGFVAMGSAMVRIGAGDLSAIPAALGGLASIFGGGESPEIKALREAIRMNERALRENTEVLSLQGGSASFEREQKGLALSMDEISGAHFKGGLPRIPEWEELDEILRKNGTSMRELEERAEELGIDITHLNYQGFLQLQEKMGQVDVAAIKAAEAMEQATDALRARQQFEEQLDDLHDVTSAGGRSGGMRAAQAGIPALAGLFAQNLDKESGRTAADAEIKRLFLEAEKLTQEQRGNLSVEDFRALLLNWENLLDEMREDEKTRTQNEQQETVDNRLEREKREAFEKLRVRAEAIGGGAKDAVERAAKLIAEAVTLESGPLGKDGPLAQDARRRADEAIAEAERITGQVAEGAITPGFTVQRTVTESSAGRFISELVTSNVLLSEIRDLIRVGAPAGATPAGGGWMQPAIEVPVYLDGEVIARVVSDYQARRYQGHMMNGGAAGMPG